MFERVLNRSFGMGKLLWPFYIFFLSYFRLILSTLVKNLSIFSDPNLQTCLKIDASSEGLGALLEQNHWTLTHLKWYPARYALRLLRDYKKLNAQIEKETFSIVFGVERFHKYLYGRNFTVINDDQPLKPIFSKSIVSCPPDIQKFFLRLQKYEFYLKYTPGNTMFVSDPLSRAYIKNSKPEFDENSLIHCVTL